MLTALTTAADVSGLATTAQTILVAAVGIALGFAAYKLIKRSLSRV